MDKQILRDYIHACALAREVDAEIQSLRKKRKTIIQTNVKGSNPEFPYQEQHFKIQGMAFTYRDDSKLRDKEEVLEQQKAKAEELKLQVEQWMLTIPMLMQRIIRFKFFQGMSWDEVAAQMAQTGDTKGGDAWRKEFESFLKEN